MSSRLGSEDQPLRVAVIGSGPAGFYVAESLLKSDLNVQVDMFDRLPTPFGLVRFGVAPDHQKIKSVTRVFDRIAKNENFRFYGNVEIGKDITLDELKARYHQLCFATGAQTDRQMGIPGEDLPRSHAATEFVAWFNGHPDYRDREFDLTAENVAIVGVGNVAVDVARILCRTPEELAKTDIADHALEALSKSKVRNVYMLGRRGPAQAAFTNPEARELGELIGADIHVPAEEAELDPLSAAELEGTEDKNLRTKVEIVQDFASREREGKPRLLTLRFLVSPVELVAGEDGGVRVMRIEKNELVSDGERTFPMGTGHIEELPVDLVFRSVGYRGVPIEGLPFHERWGVIPNEDGRVADPETGDPLPGLYVSGWIKRGPSGVIGTNKKDGTETAAGMIEDVEASVTLQPTDTDPASIDALVHERQPDVVDYEDWTRVDAIELAKGEQSGRPRVKFTSRAQIKEVLTDG
ncbi:MAG: FAD-dependent oxidoreductase [Gemmatimonadota bacterium]|jgi:ferredoxin--NADP+ reductase